MEAWQEILQNPDQLDNDIDNLQKLKVAVGDFRKSEGEKTSKLLSLQQHYCNTIALRVPSHSCKSQIQIQKPYSNNGGSMVKIFWMAN
ncbi:hypothetical protein FGO68_gene5016 [Halteria grandinella]|uniref:Uncharacterized protein n=1 Tax=Halteria grandinella TaxID=5974 RepID=A0A8J8NAM4_HALGN|nr:hypothetical protein FGO68_gene5016 [Halteria grandinella]